MSVSTHGLRVRRGPQALRAGVELFSSMRFAIALLTIICIASIIGTVLKQHEPFGNYVNQFGPFWAELFRAARLDAIYSAWWFLLILLFLVISTSLCIARNTPHILKDLKTFKEDIRAQSLKAFGQRAAATLGEAPEAAAQRIGQLLAGGGWKVKLQHREGAGWMVAARAGGAHKLGYIAAHSAIVLICIGGLFDGDLVVRAQTWFNGKSVFTGGGMIADVPAEHRLSPSNPTFRGNILVPEGGRSSVAILNQSDGVLLQELPFAIELKKFIVDYYSTGMPKLFASEVVLHDRETGAEVPARIEVNHPASYKGVEIYQSSFDDGGSTVKLKAVPMAAAAKPFELEGTIGGSSDITNGSDKLTLEYVALRVINVENFGDEANGPMTSGADVRKVDLQHSLESRLGAANKTNKPKVLRNIGPSIGYKLRDAAGQAREYQNYMVPVDTGDGQPVFLLGMRERPEDPFRYLRVPADENGSMDGFTRMRDALADDALRARAVERYVARASDPQRPELAEQLRASTTRALALFAGIERVKVDATSKGGWQAIAEFMELNVPEAERARAGAVLVRILNEVLFEVLNLSRERAGLAALPGDDKSQAFLTQAVLAMSDAHFYPAPFAMMMTDFKQVQASVFQVARAPGKSVVYLGCLLLIVGIFAMLYVRERRLWIWLVPEGTGGSGATMAFSVNRRTMDSDREFDNLKNKLLDLHKEPAP
ncbi:cytochrome c biogenesis protein ResB [Variovorax arabinosiphilus]|uniref:cytochrome c biogenesis protein ResB n=1 Tax=Variovorax arabinosiphilus TaxID=3053498 RepID=UPI0025777630|nr:MULTISPECIES: cytochrome c biogenesis protein ResB [unclassified Variovorax]MDM0120591.1 cytochrome c biogenesis protein ResB [Variovorax sp. J2L1-78]MDM0127497.1 cytochrome c biogenesis protein ResB [Variovorax sp. J2L1-63]MDM0231196.1 cytochrome c biogenesis protein ResB [Variovorax sp. J2R1-6]